MEHKKGPADGNESCIPLTGKSAVIFKGVMRSLVIGVFVIAMTDFKPLKRWSEHTIRQELKTKPHKNTIYKGDIDQALGDYK